MNIPNLSIFNKNNEDISFAGDAVLRPILLFDIDVGCSALQHLFGLLKHPIVVIKCKPLFPKVKIYNQGNKKVRQAIQQKLSIYQKSNSLVVVSNDLETKVRELVDVSNLLNLTTMLVSDERYHNNFYQNKREGYDYPITDISCFASIEASEEMRSRSRVGGAIEYIGQDKNNIETIDMDLQSRKICLIDDIPVNTVVWLADVALEYGFKVFINGALISKVDRDKYNSSCEIINSSKQIQKVRLYSNIIYQNKNEYILNKVHTKYSNLSEALIPLTNDCSKKSLELDRDFIIDAGLLSEFIEKDYKKRTYKTVAINIKKGQNLLESLYWYPRLLGCENHIIYRGGDIAADLYVSFGLPEHSKISEISELAKKNNSEYFNLENGFSAFTGIALLNSARSHSIIVDKKSMYFDGVHGSSMEDKILFSSELSEKDYLYASECMCFLIGHNISKYNHAPIFSPVLPGKNKSKILVIDQRFGDKSIAFSGATEKSFLEMLDCAIIENPNADIIVKVHPDALTGLVKGHYTKEVECLPRVYLYAKDINPISLLKMIDKVYAVSSQMGFEALMLGKSVTLFGHAIYGGWGLTEDRVEYSRRGGINKSLIELFHLLYIENVSYVSPKNGNLIEFLSYLEELSLVNTGDDLSPSILNLGDGEFTFNEITKSYTIEKNGLVSFNTIINLLGNIENPKEIPVVLNNLIKNEKLPADCETLFAMNEFMQGELTLLALVDNFKSQPKILKVFKVIITFRHRFDPNSIFEILSALISRSESAELQERIINWIVSYFKRIGDEGNLAKAVELTNSLDKDKQIKLLKISKL